MSKGIKILLTLMITLVVLLGATLYFVSSKINPELIRKLAKENVEKNFPNTEIKISEVDYQIGTKVALEVKGVDFYLKKDKTKLMHLESLDVDIPLLAILTSGGAIEIKTSSPEIFVKQRGEELNWKTAFEQEKSKKTPTEGNQKNQNTNETTDIKVPSFIEKSKLNFRMKNLKVILDKGENEVSNFSISRLKIINLNLRKSTAYELALKINYKLNPNESFKTNIQLVGEIRLKELLESQTVKLSSQLKVTSSSLDGLELKIPNLKGDITVNGKIDNLSAKLNLDIDNIVSLSSNAQVTSSKISLDAINVRLFLREALKLLENQLGSVAKDIDASKSEVFVSGKLDYSLDDATILPSLNIESKKNVGINLVKDIPISLSFSGKIQKTEMTIDIQNQVLGGNVNTKVTTALDVNNLPSSVETLPLLRANTTITGISISKKLIQEKLYAKNKPSKQNEPSDTAEAMPENIQPATPIELPSALLTLSGENIKIDNEVISFDSRINVATNTIKSESTSLVYGKGNVSVRFSSLLKTTQDIKNNFSVRFNNVSVAAFNAFFPPYLSDIKGTFQGDVKGDLDIKKNLSYNVSAKVSGKNGEMKNLNIMQFLRPTLEGISLLKGKVPKKYNVSDKFDSLDLNVFASEKNIKVSKLSLVGNKKESKLNASGNISMIEKDSTIIGDIYVKEIASQIEEVSAQSMIPFKLDGLGYGIKPDLRYTTDKLTTLAARSAAKKAKKDIDNKIKQKSKKLEKDLKKKLEDELKKKFKGFSL